MKKFFAIALSALLFVFGAAFFAASLQELSGGRMAAFPSQGYMVFT